MELLCSTNGLTIQEYFTRVDRFDRVARPPGWHVSVAEGEGHQRHQVSH